MKRLLCILAAATMLFGLAGQAAAYFENFELFRVGYGNGVEVANDLGSVSSVLSSAPGTKFGAGDLEMKLASFGGATWDQVNVAYFAVGPTAGTPQGGGLNKYEAWLSDSSGSAPVSGSRKWNALTGAYGQAQTYYSFLAGAGTGEKQVIGATGNAQSYYSNLDNGGLFVGKFAQFIATGFGEANLGALASGGYVDLPLYYFSYTASSSGAFPATTGTLAGTLRTYIDSPNSAGTMNPVPIPGGVLLLGSGLLGLFGIRRKRN